MMCTFRIFYRSNLPSPNYRADADMYRSIKRAYKNIGRDFKQMQTTDENQALDAFDRAIKYKMAKGACVVPHCYPGANLKSPQSPSPHLSSLFCFDCDCRGTRPGRGSQGTGRRRRGATEARRGGGRQTQGHVSKTVWPQIGGPPRRIASVRVSSASTALSFGTYIFTH